MSDTEHPQFFHKFQGMAAARQLRDAWIVMEADWGGQVLLTCPVAEIRCDDASLHQLHRGQAQALLLEPPEDRADQPAVDAIGLEQNQRLLHVQ